LANLRFYADLIGQTDIVARLAAVEEFLAPKGSALGHILLIGEEGMGKSTIAATVANELDVGFQCTKASAIQQGWDLTAILTNLREREVLFLENVHQLRKPIVERLWQALHELKLEIVIGQGQAARTHIMEIRPFTFIATCPKKSDCPAELLAQFSLVLELQPYSRQELQLIAERIAQRDGVTLGSGAAELIARSCDGRPGHLEAMFQRLIRPLNKSAVSEDDVLQAFTAFGINARLDKPPNARGNLQDLSGIDFEKRSAIEPPSNLRAVVGEITMLNDATNRNFDLNIEKVLEGWETCHAIREIVANALDEQMLSQTKDVEIFRTPEGEWHIRDFGRGLKYEHLTQNENEEKLRNPSKVIGKFGVGLKDALATFNRRSVDVCVRSRYGDITLDQIPKSGFTDVVTLHAIVHPAQDNSMIGTDVILRGVSDDDVMKAKAFFLRFSGEQVLDETPYGQILQRTPARNARIYITGMLVAEEENFAFSFNITSLTAAMRKALNRERTNVGRTAYSERVKQMLLASKATVVANTLDNDLMKIETGTNRDEVKWTDVAVHASQTLSASREVVFVTAAELIAHKDAIDHAQADGLRIVTIPENIKASLQGINDVQGSPIRDLSVYQFEREQSFQFKFVAYDLLSQSERSVFDQWRAIAGFVGGFPSRVREVKISETMRPDFLTSNEAVGLWDAASSSIIIKRTQLATVSAFAGILLHEIAHASSGYGDVTRGFETELTKMLGILAASQLTPRKGTFSKWFNS
jgi:Holliday junction resolvasome RuvABC ATP-dependent DNA helicase subunit